MTNEFDKIAGYKEEKKELLDLCNVIKRREELGRAGGKLPKGLFLYGPTGVGKTKLAKAFIRESKCPFVEINSNDMNGCYDFSEFIKKKFKEASAMSPCIIFIDELDKLIGQRMDPFFTATNDRSKDLLNEINRYTDNGSLFLLFVANCEWMIDEAIIRSGRIDKKIRIACPNEKERKEILQYYAKNKRFEDAVNLSNVAKITKGYSGADLESLLNDAVMKSMTNMRRFINNEDLLSAYNDKTFRCKEKDYDLSAFGQKMLAYHEAGHAAVSLLNNNNSLYYATILARGKSSGFVGEETSDKNLETIKDLKNKIKVSLGGMAAEQIFLKKRSTGSSTDISKAQRLIREIVCTHCAYGFDKIGEENNHNEFGLTIDNRSEYKKRKTERLENKLFDDLYTSAKQTLLDNRDLVKSIAKALIEKKVLDKDELTKIYKDYKKNIKEQGEASLYGNGGSPLYN